MLVSVTIGNSKLIVLVWAVPPRDSALETEATGGRNVLVMRSDEEIAVAGVGVGSNTDVVGVVLTVVVGNTES